VSDRLLKLDSLETLGGIYARLTTMVKSSIFRGKQPPFDRSVPLWRFDLHWLPRDEARAFVELYLAEVFAASKMRGEVATADTFVVLDEAAIFLDETDPDSIFPILAREARKFGISLILSSQRLGHFSDDVLLNSATKIILGVDESEAEPLRRRLRLEHYEDKAGRKRNPLLQIRPRETALVQMKVAGGQGPAQTPIEVKLKG
jgi:DNA helicase HerA-like ATPase